MTSQIENSDAAPTPNNRAIGLRYFLEGQAQNPTFFDTLLGDIDMESTWAGLSAEERDAISAVEQHFHPTDLSERSRSTREVLVALYIINELHLIDILNQTVELPTGPPEASDLRG